ncbi:MAG TPA: hypothetical protein VET46_02575 [Steroidobacteraceae bacterium]|nr:hypothetical protein [Steroidobacteraceae bacterium]
MGRIPAAAGVLGLTLAAACTPAGSGKAGAASAQPPAGNAGTSAQQQQPENDDLTGPEPGRTRESNRHARDRSERDQ